MHKGIVIQKSTREKDYERAKIVAEIEINKLKDSTRPVIDKNLWNDYIDSIAEDKTQWVHRLFVSVQKRRNIVKRGCTLNKDQILRLLKRSCGRCEVTKIPFDTKNNIGRTTLTPWRPSIDRINSKEGYHFANCRIVCLAVNMAMNKWGGEVMTIIGKAMLLKELTADIEKNVVNTLYNDFSDTHGILNQVLDLYGSPGRARTADLVINSQNNTLQL